MGKKMRGAELTQAMPSSSQSSHDYETEGALSDLQRAADHLDDPVKLKKIHKLAGRRHKSVSALIEPHMEDKRPKSLQELRAIAAKKPMPKDSGGDL